jgi:NADH-quinone oxidoreductase subunit A
VEGSTSVAAPLWPLAVYFLGVLILLAGMMVLPFLLGPRHRDPQTGQQFESGIKSTGSARVRWHVKYYLVAMFFVIFDLESVFLVAWAVAVRELGWPGYFEALIFVGVLLLSLAYLWKVGALEWGTERRRGVAARRTPRPLVSALDEKTTSGSGASTNRA